MLLLSENAFTLCRVVEIQSCAALQRWLRLEYAKNELVGELASKADKNEAAVLHRQMKAVEYIKICAIDCVQREAPNSEERISVKLNANSKNKTTDAITAWQLLLQKRRLCQNISLDFAHFKK